MPDGGRFGMIWRMDEMLKKWPGGLTREQAVELGAEIAEHAAELAPPPVRKSMLAVVEALRGWLAGHTSGEDCRIAALECEALVRDHFPQLDEHCFSGVVDYLAHVTDGGSTENVYAAAYNARTAAAMSGWNRHPERRPGIYNEAFSAEKAWQMERVKAAYERAGLL